jgi:hypothetical protein
MLFQNKKSRGPRILKSLDGYHEWTIKHRHWTFDALQDELHDVWISTSDLRRFFDKFPADEDLKKTYWRTMLYTKEHKTYYLAERTMRTLLSSKSKHLSFHTEVLKFLDWFDRNISQVAARKRANNHLDVRNEHREAHAATVTGPLPASKSHPGLEDSTLPLTPQERWALEQSGESIRRVYHPEARPVRVGMGEILRNLLVIAWGRIKAYFHGEYSLLSTFLLGILVLMVPAKFLGIALPVSGEWTTHYQRVIWAYASATFIAAVCCLGYVVALSRSLACAWKNASARIAAVTFYLLVVPLSQIVMSLWYDEDMLECWWAMVRGNYQPMTIYADPHLGRIVASGPMEFGSSEMLLDVLKKNPSYTLIQLESPGGFMIEGLRMAQLVHDRHLDTVTLNRCASACTLVMVTGQERYLGPDARMGFHRSGYAHVFEDQGWTRVDFEIADHFRKYGAKDDFIAKALSEPMFRIWWAPHEDMYSAGFASAAWADRKSGY